MNKRCVIWCAVSSEEQAKDDKLSLVTQETEMRQFASEQGWDVVQVFMWDGYSRWESDPVAALEDFAEQGRFEYHELRRMWREKAFDILLLYTHSRAGRSFTMQSWVVENVIRHGGEIYRIHGGWINKRDYAFQIGIGGVLSTADIDRLIEQRYHAMNKRATQGLPTSSSPPASHVVLRDELGRPARDASGKLLPMAVNEQLRRFWLDAATLFLEGVSFKTLERELYERYGHVDKSGQPYKPNFVRQLYMNAAFWGHSARFYRDGRKHGYKDGDWVYDETLPPPEGVLLHRHTHEPVYTGEMAERVKAELQRRRVVARGRSSSRRTGRFTGLFICAECTYYYTYDRKGTWVYLYCGARNVGTYRSQACSQSTGLTEKEAQTYIHKVLEAALDAGSLEAAFAAQSTDEDSSAVRKSLLENEVTELEVQAHRLVLKQAASPDSLSHIYDAEIQRLGERLGILKGELTRLTYAEERQRLERYQEQETLDMLAELGLPVFWAQSDTTINQMLHRLLGNKRFAVLNGEVIPRLVPAPPTKRR